MSYDGHLGFGLLADYDAVPELESIARDLDRAIASLGRAAGALPTRKRSARKAAASAERRGAPRKAARAPAAASSVNGSSATGKSGAGKGPAGKRAEDLRSLASPPRGADGQGRCHDAPGALPDQRHGRRHLRQRAAHPLRPACRARGRRRARADCPSSPSPATRPRICCCASTSSPTPAPPWRSWPGRSPARPRSWAFPSWRSDRVYNAAAVLADGSRQVDLSQGPSPQLRRVRRAALLRRRRRRERASRWPAAASA